MNVNQAHLLNAAFERNLLQEAQAKRDSRSGSYIDRLVRVLAVGVKEGNKLTIGGEDVTL